MDFICHDDLRRKHINGMNIDYNNGNNYIIPKYVKQQRPSLYRHRTKRGGPMVETSAIVILRHEENHAYISTTYAIVDLTKYILLLLETKIIIFK